MPTARSRKGRSGPTETLPQHHSDLVKNAFDCERVAFPSLESQGSELPVYLALSPPLNQGLGLRVPRTFSSEVPRALTHKMVLVFSN